MAKRETRQWSSDRESGRGVYSFEFKLRAVQEAKRGTSRKVLARMLRISPTTLATWCVIFGSIAMLWSLVMMLFIRFR